MRGPLDQPVSECKVKCIDGVVNITRRENHRRALLSRYKDNIYICLVNIPPDELEMIRRFLEKFLLSDYGIPLKWQRLRLLVLRENRGFSS